MHSPLLTLSLLALVCPGAAYYYYYGDDNYEEYENNIISNAPKDFTYLYERKVAYEYGVEDEGFGKSVSVNGDRVLVGSFEDPSRGDKAGAAHIFIMDSSLMGWTRVATLRTNDTQAYDYFGWTVSLGNNFALIGAWQNDGAGNNAGAAYFFQKVSDYYKDGKEEWVLHTKIYGWEQDDSFGMSVALGNDRIAAIGAPGGSTVDGDHGSGYVSVFRYNGYTWAETDVIEAADGGAGHFFGMTIALEPTTNMLAVSAYGHGLYGNKNVGQVYVYDISGMGNPIEVQTLKAHDAAGSDEFGRSVSILGDLIAVGATGDDDSGQSSGSVYLFKYGGAGGLSSQWVQKQKLMPEDDCTFCYFGAQIAMTNDTLAIGLHGGSQVPGTVWTYKKTKYDDFEFLYVLNSTDSVNGDQFGSSIAIDSNYLVVGALTSNGYDYETGAVYVYSKQRHYVEEEEDLSSMLVFSLVAVVFAVCAASGVYFFYFGSKPAGWNHEVCTRFKISCVYFFLSHSFLLEHSDVVQTF